MKTVWVLGAGASLSASGGVAPTLLRVPRFAVDAGVAIGKSRTRDGIYPELCSYVRKYFGVDLAAGPSVNLEEVLTLLDIETAIEGIDSIHLARNQLVRYLQDTFRRLETRLDGIALPEFDALAGLLSRDDSVITFNWDLLLDRALGREFLLSGSPSPVSATQYSTFNQTFTARAEATWDNISHPPPLHRWSGTTGHYLKLHGSIDWVSCHRIGCRNSGKLFILEEYGTLPECGFCLEPVSWLLVPPTLNKRLFDIPVIRRLWTYAAREIASAQRLIVWGYSLPPTDFFSTWLLRRRSEKPLEELVLINPATLTGKTKPRPNKGFLERFKSLVEERKPATVLVYEDFAHFQSKVDVVSKYPGAGTRIRAYLGAP